VASAWCSPAHGISGIDRGWPRTLKFPYRKREFQGTMHHA
jgi:hypothetical protein